MEVLTYCIKATMDISLWVQVGGFAADRDCDFEYSIESINIMLLRFFEILLF